MLARIAVALVLLAPVASAENECPLPFCLIEEVRSEDPDCAAEGSEGERRTTAGALGAGASGHSRCQNPEGPARDEQTMIYGGVGGWVFFSWRHEGGGRESCEMHLSAPGVSPTRDCPAGGPPRLAWGELLP